MTLQDYTNLVTSSLSDLIDTTLTLIIPLSTALIIFLVGLIIAEIIKKTWFEIIKFLNIEKSFLKNESYAKMVKSNKNLSLTLGIGQILWWLTILVFLLPSLKILNFTKVDIIIGQFLDYLPAVATGGLYLFFGFVIAWLAYLITLAFGNLTKIGNALFVAKTIAATILTFSTFLALKAFGLNEETIKFIVLATIGAIALAFGLSGKELAADIIKKLKEQIK